MTCYLCGTEIHRFGLLIMYTQLWMHPCCGTLCVERRRDLAPNVVVDIVMKGAPTFDQSAYVAALDLAHPGLGPIAEIILSAEGPDDTAGH